MLITNQDLLLMCPARAGVKAGRVATVAAASAAAAVAVAAALAVSASGPDGPGPDGPGGAVVYATFYPYAEFARGVAGGAAEVRQFGPTGGGAHDWEPGAADISALAGALALVHSGEGIEPYIENLAGVEQVAGVAFIAAAGPGGDGGERHEEDGHDGERHEEDGHEDDEHGAGLTHAWLDPVEAIGQVERIRDALSEIDAENARAYSSNASEYIGLISGVDERYRGGLAECEHRTIVTFHNAFGSMAGRYGLEILGIAHSHHAEPSVSQIARLADHASGSGARAIFHDDLTDGRLEAAAVEGLGVEVIALSTLEGLARGDAPDTTYIEKMDANLEALRVGLACR